MSLPHTLADEAFEREERRLYLDSYGNYAKYELFNLSHAFGLQLSRVDAEWGVYEQQMQNDYEAQRATILGKARNASVADRKTGRQGPWKSKTEQTLLFNTAPVFSPDSGISSRRQSQAVESELANLDKMYAQAQARIAAQKKSAVRWIKRQEARMKIQVAAIASDRDLVHPHLVRASNDFDRFYAQVNAAVGAARILAAKGSEETTSAAGGWQPDDGGKGENSSQGTTRELDSSGEAGTIRSLAEEANKMRLGAVAVGQG